VPPVPLLGGGVRRVAGGCFSFLSVSVGVGDECSASASSPASFDLEPGGEADSEHLRPGSPSSKAENTPVLRGPSPQRKACG